MLDHIGIINNCFIWKFNMFPGESLYSKWMGTMAGLASWIRHCSYSNTPEPQFLQCPLDHQKLQRHSGPFPPAETRNPQHWWGQCILLLITLCNTIFVAGFQVLYFNCLCLKPMEKRLHSAQTLILWPQHKKFVFIVTKQGNFYIVVHVVW